MSTPMNAADTFDERPARQPLAMRATRPYLWSVRRELWEHRAIFIVPLIAGAVALVGFVVSIGHVSHHDVAAFQALSTAKRDMAINVPYAGAAASIMGVGLVVAVFYSLGALLNERRDRSILFWKSLPVSDITAVASKATIPLVVLPLVLFVVVVLTQLVMLAILHAALAANGLPNTNPVPLSDLAIVELYTLFVFSLWHAPIYGWLFLVSAWSRRQAFLWAVLPPLGLCLTENIAFGTSNVFGLLAYRVAGVLDLAFADHPHGQMVLWAHLDPVRFFSSPGLWLGLIVAALFFSGAVWLRRYREPI